MTVLRHPHALDIPAVTADAARELDDGLAGLGHRSARLPVLFDAAIRASGLLAAKDTDAIELDRTLRLASQLGAAWWRCVAAAPGAPVGVQIGELRLAFAGIGRDDGATVWRFREAASIAAVVRDRAARRELAQIALGAVVPEGGARTALGLLRVRAWQGLLQAAAGGTAALDWMGVLEAAYKAANAIRTRTAADREAQGELEAMRALAVGDAREVNRALARMLDAFARGARVDEHRDDPRRFLALPVLAIAAVATDLGVRVELDSEYTPLRLIQGQFEELVAEDTSTHDRITLCPFCGSALPRRARACPRCANDLTQVEPIQGDPARIASLERAPCPSCGEAMLAIAHVCPSCLAWRDRRADPDEATDEVALRPFPPAYQAWLTARRAEPSTLRLPAARVRAAEAAAILRRSGLGADPIPGTPDLVDVRLPGDSAAAGFEVRDAPDGGLEIETTFGVDPCRDLWRLTRVAHALSGGGGAVDPGRVLAWSADRIAQIAESSVPPEPERLFEVALHPAPDGQRAWLATRGLTRCGVFELELLDVPVRDIDRFEALLRAAALRLVERAEPLWGEEVPFLVGEGLWVAWVPLQWARDDWPNAYGSGPERASEGGAEALSAVLVAAEPRGRKEPIASLAPLLRQGAALWTSRLGLRRRRAVARATWSRLEALRRDRPDDAVEVEVIVGDADEAVAVDTVRATFVRRDADRIVGRTAAGEATFPADALVDWAIGSGGLRVTAIDALARRGASGEHRAPPRREPADERTDPRGVDHEPERTLVTARRPERHPDSDETTRPSVPAPLPPPLPPSGEATDADLLLTGSVPTETAEPTVLLTRVPTWAVLASLVLPGVGHWGIGERRRAAWVIGAALITGGGCGLVGLWAAWDLWRRDP